MSNRILTQSRKDEIEADFSEWSSRSIYDAPKHKLEEYVDNCLYGNDSDLVSEWIVNELMYER